MESDSKTEFENYLQKSANKYTISPDVLNSVIKDATGQDADLMVKIPKGEVNQVFDVSTKRGLSVVLRISDRNINQFLSEKWAMEQCQKVGVPTADILLIKQLKLRQGNFSVCVLQKMKGDTLDRGATDMHSISDKELRDLIWQSGELLSKIHSIKTSGYGPLNPKGQGANSSFEEFVTEGVRQKEGCFQLARKHHFSLDTMEQILHTLSTQSPGYKVGDPVLNHGDYAPKHFIINNGQISGILDFGEAKSNPAVYDFAWWHYWRDEPWGKEGKLFTWLKEGYSDQKLFTAEFEELMHLIQLNLGLGIFYWYDLTGYPKGVEDAKKRLIRDLNFFRA